MSSRYEEASVRFYREHREAIYKCLQELAENGKHLPKEYYRYKYADDEDLYGVPLTTKFVGSTIAEALLNAIEYFKKNCRRSDNKEEDILQFSIEGLYNLYVPNLTTEQQIEIIFRDLSLPGVLRFYKVDQ